MFAFLRMAASGGNTPVTAAKSLLRRLIGDRSGNVAVMFAMIGIPLSGAIGLAVDMGRVYHVNLATQSALDSSALAAGRVAQVEKTDTLTKAFKSASAYFDQSKPSDVVVSTIQFSPNDQQTEFRVTATSWVRTPFLSVLNIISYRGAQDDAPAACKGNFYGCVKLVTSATAQICLNCSDTGSGNADEGTNLEISMMLDITGSMKGTPLTDMKAAAKDLIDIVIWNDQSKYTSRVALAPFSLAINAGEYFSKITGKVDREDNDGDSSKNINYPASCFKNGKLQSSCSGSTGQKTYNTPPYIAKNATCIVERGDGVLNGFAKGVTNPEKYTDAAPTSAATYLPSWNMAAAAMGSSTSVSMATTCSPTNAIVPLTTDRKKLKDAIDAFKADGYTAGQLGTAMAWYLISPNWKDVWPLESRPTPYGTAKVQKIAVLMTDGVYNTLQGDNFSDTSTEATTALNHAKSLCTGMKGKSITVYTVGFNLDSSAAKNMLKSCATSDSHYYDTSGGDALKAAFRDIALKISKLRLTN
jgi:Flp pilus assembly protein TadG